MPWPVSARRAAQRAGEDLGGVTENYNTETLDNLPTSLTRSWAPTGPVRIIDGELNHLIAPRRPPVQGMLAFRFVVERRGYKKQCKHTSKNLENDAEK